MKGTFSESGPWMQFLILAFLVLGGIVLFTSLGLMLSSLFFPLSLNEITAIVQSPSTLRDIEVLKFLQGFTTMGVFLVPGIFGAYLFSAAPATYLGIDSFPRQGVLVLVLLVLLALSGTTLSDALYRLSKSISWPESLVFLEEMLKNTEQMMGEQVEAFLRMEGPGDFVEVLFILALLPAVCEETLFRGALQPVLQKALKNPHLGIWATAFCFALLHQQFYTFLSIWALGAVLGYLRYWSGSLWVPVVVHFVNNATIVVAVYFFDLSYREVNDLSGAWQVEYALPGLVLFAVLLYSIYRLVRRDGEVEV